MTVQDLQQVQKRPRHRPFQAIFSFDLLLCHLPYNFFTLYLYLCHLASLTTTDLLPQDRIRTNSFFRSPFTSSQLWSKVQDRVQIFNHAWKFWKTAVMLEPVEKIFTQKTTSTMHSIFNPILLSHINQAIDLLRQSFNWFLMYDWLFYDIKKLVSYS